MNNISQVSNDKYHLTINETADLIATIGMFTTVFVQGHMGTGKSAILWILAKMFPTHKPIFLDCTTMVDSADMFMIKYSEDGLTFKTIPMEDLGLHLPDQPIILMFDELGKANRSVLLSANRVMLERKHSTYTMHPDSIVFANSNLGEEGVGDILPAHTRNRIAIVNMKKGDNDAAIEYGINNNFDPVLLGWYKETPDLFASFQQYTNPEENQHIFHPMSNRASFFTNRSGEAASNILKKRHLLSPIALTAALIGTIGEHSAHSLVTFIAMADELPTLEQIQNDPMNAPIPSSDAAAVLVVYRSIATIERAWVTAWFTYMNRLRPAMQSLFVNGVRQPNYSRRDYVAQNKSFRDWCTANNYQFTDDKK